MEAQALPSSPRRPSDPARNPWAAALALLFGMALTGCSDMARQSVDAGSGPDPTLPSPRTSLIPTVKVAEAVGWPPGATPKPAAGLAVNAFATGLEHPRWLYTLPNGDVLVAETNAPPKPDDGHGLRAWFMKLFMSKAGARTPSANRITLLRDTDGDGRADVRSVFVSGLNSPFGMALVDGTFYIANTDGVVKLPYRTGATRLEGTPEAVMPLPAGPINHHWTKNIIASPDGQRLYATVGSNSNVAENGLQAEEGRAAIHVLNLSSGQHRVYASGLRNPNGLAWVPGPTPTLWTAVNERDELGSDLVPDYMTAVHDGDFYGWPYSYYGSHVDERVQPPRPERVAAARVPDYALGPHTASLGLHWLREDSALAKQLGTGMVIGQHGSWNREPPSGYRVVFVRFADGKPTGLPDTLLDGFLDAEGHARGRPVGVEQSAVWRVTPAQR